MNASIFPIGPNVRRLREQRGISLSALARKAGISKAYLSQLENDPNKKPSAEIVYHLAQALDVDITTVMGIDDAAASRAEDAAEGLPAGLRVFWSEHPELPLEDIRLLAALGRRGRGLNATDYWLIHETIRLATRRHLQG